MKQVKHPELTSLAYAALAAIRRDQEAAATVCSKCGEKYSADDLAELREMGETFNRGPFMCPDCYDRFRRKDLEDQFGDLMGGRH